MSLNLLKKSRKHFPKHLATPLTTPLITVNLVIMLSEQLCEFSSHVETKKPPGSQGDCTLDANRCSVPCERTENYDDSNGEQLVNISSPSAAKNPYRRGVAVAKDLESPRESQSSELASSRSPLTTKRQRSTAKRNDWTVELESKARSHFPVA